MTFRSIKQTTLVKVVMIGLKKSFRRSYYLEFDKQGTIDIINYLRNLNTSYALNILHNEASKEFYIFLDESNENFNLNPKKVELNLDEEEIEYFLYRLEKCLEDKVFFPAELCEKKLGKQDISLYARYL